MIHTLSAVELDRYVTIEHVIRGDLLQKEAAEQLGISCRQVSRLQREVEQQGAKGVKRCPKGGNRRHEEAFKESVLKAVKRHYSDFGPTFSSEKLAEADAKPINVATDPGVRVCCLSNSDKRTNRHDDNYLFIMNNFHSRT